MANLNEHWNQLSKEAKDLVLFADADRDLHKQSLTPILSNLSKKAKKDIYDPKLAQKLWGYHADRAAIKMHKDCGDCTQKWHKAHSVGVRKEAAMHWEAFHRDGLKDFNAEKHMKESIDEGTDEVLMNPYADHYLMLDAVLHGKPVEFQELFDSVVTSKLRTEVENVKDAMRPGLFTKEEEPTISSTDSKNPALAKYFT